MIPAGRLNQRVAIEHEVRVPDGGGGFETTWHPLANVWASVEALRGLERLTAAQQESSADYRVTIRWRAGLTAALRVRWRHLRLDVQAVADNGPQAGDIVLHCQSMGAE